MHFEKNILELLYQGSWQESLMMNNSELFIFSIKISDQSGIPQKILPFIIRVGILISEKLANSGIELKLFKV